MRPTLRLLASVAGSLSILISGCGSSPPSQLVGPDGGLIAGTTCSKDYSVCWTILPSATAAVNDGNTPTQVTVTLSNGGTPVPDGTQGNFAFESAPAASFAPIQPGPNQTNAQTVQANSANGQINIQVYDLAVETVTISLQANVLYSTSSSTLSGTASITFGGKCSDSFITPTSNTSSGNGSGVATFISLKCNDAVMGGSFAYQKGHPFEGNTQSCTAFVGDGPAQGVANAAVQYLTEAGAIESSVKEAGQHPTEITNSAGEAQVSFHVQTPYPEDVDYDATQDGTWTDTSQPRMWTDVNSHTYNPRDGWVTLIAATAGKPQQGGSQLIPEPYVDSNDNGQWDPGEFFIDVNCNGKYDTVQTPDANGYIRIWTSTTVVWVDVPYPAATGADPAAVAGGVVSGEIPSLENPSKCASYIHAGETCNMVFRFTDINSNLPSTMLSGNLLTSSTPSSSCPLTPSGAVAVDLTYSEQPLAVTDYPFSLVDTVATNPAPVAGSYQFPVVGTFNYSDVNEPENATLNLPTTISVGTGVGGGCDAPGT